MKKRFVAIGALVVLAAAGYFGYRYFSSSASYGTVNVNLGAVEASKLCKDLSGHPRVVCLSNELKKSLSAELAGKVQLNYSVAEAQKWSNFPPAGYRNRIGATLDQFSKEQLTIIKAILLEATGTAKNEGYDELEQILNADDFLNANITGSNGGFSSGNFYLAFLGTPSDKDLWQLYFGGHHLAVGFTYQDGKLIGATPSFRGVEPFEKFTQNGRENEPMKQEQEAFAAMLKALDEKEKAAAKLSQTFSDIIVGPQKDTSYPTLRNGVKVGDLSPEKQQLVVKAIETYIADSSDADAKTIIEKYKSEFADTFLAFSGTPELNTANDYVRVDGPSVWIEISMQNAASWTGIHPHSVWRDKRSDYGGNLGK